jgi:parallel beta-helix repeat protein
MKKLIFILFLFLNLTLSASKYYVTKTGDDGNAGSLASPFLTITKGESVLTAGDTLYVRSGTYNESLLFYQCDGTLGDLTVIMAYPGEYPIIDGTDISIGAGSSLVTIYATYVKLTGFEIRNVNILGLYAGGTGIYCGGNYSIISNCVVYDTFGSGIQLDALGNIVEYCTVYNTSMNNVGGVVFGNAGGIAARSNSSYGIIRHNIVHDIWGEAVSTCETNNNIIEDNIIYDSWTVALYVMDSPNTLVQRNLVYRTKVMGINDAPVGIGVWNEVLDEPDNANVTIINNIVYGCDRNFKSTFDIDGLIVSNNTFVNSTAYECVQFAGVHINSLFANNIVVQEDALPCISYVTNASGLAFSNNLYNKAYEEGAVGTNDIIGDPLFANSATYNFRLQVTSPAINTGTIISSRTKDFVDHLITDGLPDIGAYEYGKWWITRNNLIVRDANGKIITITQ